jgi:sulfonate transport system permease protein
MGIVMTTLIRSVLSRGISTEILAAEWATLSVSLKRSLKAFYVPILALVIWEFNTRLQIVPPQTLPSLEQVFATFIELMLTGELLTNFLISLKRVVIGFAWGVPTGALLGFALARVEVLEALIYPTFRAISQVPNLAWIPLLMMFVGIGEELKFIIIAKATIIPMTINTFQGVRYVPSTYSEVARVFQLTKVQILVRVFLPAALPQILTGLRSSLNHAWLALVIVELLSSSEGLGFLMVWGRQLFQMDLVMVTMIVIGTTGLALDLVLRHIERKLLHWRPESPERRMS